MYDYSFCVLVPSKICKERPNFDLLTFLYVVSTFTRSILVSSLPILSALSPEWNCRVHLIFGTVGDVDLALVKIIIVIICLIEVGMRVFIVELIFSIFDCNVLGLDSPCRHNSSLALLLNFLLDSLS